MTWMMLHVKVKYLKSDVKKNLQGKNNNYVKGLSGCIGCSRSQSNRPVSWIKRKVNSSISLFKSLERP